VLAISHVWWCALTGRRGPLLRVALSALAGEGLRMLANRGNYQSQADLRPGLGASCQRGKSVA
jgi:hypothetical protein